MTYSEKLKDPRWQKKRLKILERDKWKCTECGNSKKTLHVHHKTYVRGKSPWQYKDDNFQTLCETCHGAKHKKKEPEKHETHVSGVFRVNKEDLKRIAEEWQKREDEKKTQLISWGKVGTLEKIREQYSDMADVELKIDPYVPEKPVVVVKTSVKLGALNKIREQYANIKFDQFGNIIKESK